MNIYSLVVSIYFNLSDLYCLGMVTDLSQSLDLSIYWHKDYIMLISTADWTDLVLYYLPITADRCIYDISSKINDMSSALSRSAIVYGFNHSFFAFTSCWLQDQINWHACIPEGEFWTCTGVKQISQVSCFPSTPTTHTPPRQQRGRRQRRRRPRRPAASRNDVNEESGDGFGCIWRKHLQAKIHSQK